MAVPVSTNTEQSYVSVVDSADHYFRSQTLDAKSILSLFSIVGFLRAEAILKP